jgi:hypothetical protein
MTAACYTYYDNSVSVTHHKSVSLPPGATFNDETLRRRHRLRLVQAPRLKALRRGGEFLVPGPNTSFKVLQPGEPFLFKLHSPRNFIVGGGFFLKFLPLPVSLAWEAFKEGNGARSLDAVKTRIAKY